MMTTSPFTLSRAHLIVRQFQGLQGRHPSSWPVIPRTLCGLAVGLLVVIIGGWLLWRAQWEQLASGRAEEEREKQAFVEKIHQASHLDRLRQQKALVQSQVEKLEQQLPDKSEMDALLSEINQAGINRHLQFELFKPGQIRLHDYYAELPIEIKLSGNYHALAGFVSDIASLPRIVTLNQISITQLREGVQGFEGVIHTFRYLDKEEVALRKKSAEEQKKQGKR